MTIQQRAEQLAIEIYTHVDDAGDWGVYEITPAIASALRAVANDYEEVLTDQRRLVRKLDVLMNGDDAAKQASLCDIVGQFPDWKQKALRAEREACAVIADDLRNENGDYIAKAIRSREEQ